MTADSKILKFSDMLTRHKLAHPSKTALERGTTLVAYGDLKNLVTGRAGQLLASGITRNSIAGISITDEIDHLIVSLALLEVGCCQVAVATFDPDTARESLSSRAKVTHIISTDEKFALPGIPLVLLSRPADYPMPAEAQAKIHANNAPGSLYLHTSGTTSRSNIVPFSEYQLAMQAQTCQEYSAERLLRLASVEHNNAKRHRLYTLYVGGTVILKEEHDFDLPEFCFRHNVTCVELSRMHAANLIASNDTGGVHSLRNVKVRIAGSSLPLDMRSAMEQKVTANLYLRYAATECGVVAMALPGQHARETVGIPFARVNVEIIGNDGALLPANTIGEIRVRAPGMAESYLDNPEQSRNRFRGGWFYPGDLGEFLDDGQLVVHGRKDDMIILNSINIYPSHLEKILEQHPAVKESAVFGLASGVHGQIPVAAVELKPGAVASDKELLKFAREKLGLRAPRKIVVLEKLPRNSQGKVVKTVIAESFREKSKA